MITQFDALNDTPDSACSQGTVVPMEQLVEEVYACSEPDLQQHMLAKLVGKVFETASVSLRTRLLEQLLQPVDMLSLLTIANGRFAGIRFRSAWPATHLQPEDVQRLQGEDVVALVEHVLHARADALNGLSRVLLSSPQLAGSGAAAVLVAILLERARGHAQGKQRSNRVISQFAAL